jgi:hypothetical protein
MWAVPLDRLDEDTDVAMVAPLDLDAELTKFGADTEGRRA